MNVALTKVQSGKGPTRAAPINMREHQRQATCKTVIQAATKLFAARGFEGTTLPSIASECGVPVPLMVYHFKSKDQLWRTCVDDVYARFNRRIEIQDAKIVETTGLPYFREKIRSQIKALAAEPEYMRILFQEGTYNTPRLEWLVEKHQRRMTDQISASIEQAQREGLLPPMDVVHAKFILSGALSFPIVLAAEYRLIDNVDPQSDAFIDRHVDLFMRLFMPGPAQPA
jgi:TetR/AcrR family transcriptional regulator